MFAIRISNILGLILLLVLEHIHAVARTIPGRTRRARPILSIARPTLLTLHRSARSTAYGDSRIILTYTHAHTHTLTKYKHYII